ncbi:3-oxoacyl-[acyl-carrier protein] reductase [Pseudomonas yamanorum]|uniref:SDR family NAD(P)-dependent oxidoreductase n=1 Tax=Pseudomonas yamanorum TaxID=515393 RepID=UPI0007A5013B|nr:SDR family oxidoreductase [Pseudomonas yamanorum]AMW82961.1 3-oxoacyl-[acyl-carrier protein] reductase [Pseudomonas yamanorum]
MNRIALVTGASRGLGECIARRLHAAGYRVGLADVHLDGVQRLASELDNHGETAVAIELDVRNKADFIRARDLLSERWGGTDILVNNAGVSKVAALMDITSEEFDESMAINLRGTFVACQVFGAHFAERGFGRIVNIASLAGQNGGTATGAHYAAAKGGVATLTKVFARELAPRGVTVNSISPGPLDLPVVRETVAPERLEQILKIIPTGTLGDPRTIADTVLLLIADHAASITGACWDINGGLFMR